MLYQDVLHVKLHTITCARTMPPGTTSRTIWSNTVQPCTQSAVADVIRTTALEQGAAYHLPPPPAIENKCTADCAKLRRRGRQIRACNQAGIGRPDRRRAAHHLCEALT